MFTDRTDDILIRWDFFITFTISSAKQMMVCDLLIWSLAKIQSGRLSLAYLVRSTFPCCVQYHTHLISFPSNLWPTRSPPANHLLAVKVFSISAVISVLQGILWPTSTPSPPQPWMPGHLQSNSEAGFLHHDVVLTSSSLSAPPPAWCWEGASSWNHLIRKNALHGDLLPVPNSTLSVYNFKTFTVSQIPVHFFSS